MVFWSTFSKKIKQAVSQISFDTLKRRVEVIEGDYATKTYTDQQNTAQDNKIAANTSNIATNTSNITNNTNNINTLDTKVDGVISGLQNGNIVNYAGEYNNSTNYKLAQAVTLSGEWFVSKQNNNVGHTPTKTNNNYWVYISAPTVDLTPYLTKTSAASTYATINTTNGIDTRLRSAETTLGKNSTNIVNLDQTKAAKSEVYSKTESDNKFALKSSSLNYQNVPFTNHFNLIRDTVYFGNRRIKLYRMVNVSVNLGLIENVVFKSNDNVFVAFSWYIDVYNSELKILLDRFDNTNNWTPNFSVDIYTRAQ